LIPNRLKKENIRFIKVIAKDKKPIETGWQKDKNYNYDDEELLNHIKSGGNYGVATGFGDLIVIDSDHTDTQKAVDEVLPKTFQVTTGKGTHNYYICSGLKEKIVLNNDDMGQHYGEVQTVGQQVVGAGSTHPNGHKYSIKNDIDIVKVDVGQVRFALRNLMKKNVSIVPQQTTDLDIDLSISKIANTGRLKKVGAEWVGPHPVHGSSGGCNFSINPNKNLWHCFRCDTGGGPLQLIAVQEGILSCSDSCNGGLRGDKFKKTLMVAQEKYGLKKIPYEVEEVTWDIYSEKELKEQVMLLLAIGNKKRAEATEMVAQFFVRKNNVYVIRDDKIEEFWIYQNGIYVRHGKTYILEFCRKIMGQAYNSHFANLVAEKITTDNYINPNDFFTINYKDEIVVNNGILNVVTRELKPHTPRQVFTSRVPIKYNPDAKCPHIQQFFKDILKDNQDILKMQELSGYLLYKDLFIQKAFMFSGNRRNGKGKTLELFRRMLGHTNFCALSLHQITTDKFMLAGLFSKMANLAGDISSKEIPNIEIFKNITGQDDIECDRKFSTSIIFKSYAKQIFCCNELPQPEESQKAFWERWEYIEFPYTFQTKEDMAKMDEEELKNTKLKDPDIIEKICTPEEMEGMLIWALEGLKRLLNNKNFTNSHSGDEVENIWKRSDSLLAFMEDHIEPNYEAGVDKRELLAYYKKYCMKNKVKMKSNAHLKDMLMAEHGCMINRKMINGQYLYIVEGIQFKGGTIDDGVSTLYFS